jgi:hypothetical protein
MTFGERRPGFKITGNRVAERSSARQAKAGGIMAVSGRSRVGHQRLMHPTGTNA